MGRRGKGGSEMRVSDVGQISKSEITKVSQGGQEAKLGRKGNDKGMRMGWEVYKVELASPPRSLVCAQDLECKINTLTKERISECTSW